MQPTSSIDSQIRARSDAFAAELALLVRQSALQAVADALGEIVAPARRGPGRPRTAVRAAVQRVARRARRAAKRTPEQVLELAARVHAHVRANAGQTVEQIGRAMRIPTKVLQLPIAKLLQAKKLRTEGRRRGTRYFAGGGATRAARPARRGRARKARVTASRKRAAKTKTPAVTLKPTRRAEARGAQVAKPFAAPAAAQVSAAAAT